MQTARRYDPTKGAKFHVSIATTEEVRRKWAMHLESLRRPKGTVLTEGALDEITVTKTVEATQVGDAASGPSPAFEIAGQSRAAESAPPAAIGLWARWCASLTANHDSCRTVPSQAISWFEVECTGPSPGAVLQAEERALGVLPGALRRFLVCQLAQ
jgi:hypothetical protein